MSNLNEKLRYKIMALSNQKYLLLDPLITPRLRNLEMGHQHLPKFIQHHGSSTPDDLVTE